MSKPRVAFVASGGATKGIAHLGALRAMEELDLRPDLFVGASAGAIASAFYAQGLTADQMVDWFRPFWKRHEPSRALKGRYFVGAPTLDQWLSPGYLTSGLLSIDRFERFLRDELPVNDFRKLSRPLIVTATDVDGRGRVVFGRGYDDATPISQAVAASSCVPMLYRPYRIGGRYFVDGEVVRTLSMDLAIEAGADVIVISNVYRPHVTQPTERSLAQRGIAHMFRQTLNVILSEKEKRGIDLLHRLYPHVTILNVSADLGSYSFINRGDARSLLQRGYREALRVLSVAKTRGVFAHKSNVRAIGDA